MLWPEDKRYSYRHVLNVPTTFTLYHPDLKQTEHVGVTVDLNEGGVGLVSFQPAPIGSAIHLTLDAGKEKIHLTGQVRWSKEVADKRLKQSYGWRFGVKFDELAPESLDAVNRLALHYGVSRLFHEYEMGNRQSTAVSLRKTIANLVHRKRDEHRRTFKLPVWIHRSGREAAMLVVTEDIHQTSFAALVDEPISVGEKVEFRVESPFDPITGAAKVVRKEKRQYGAGTVRWSRSNTPISTATAPRRSTISSGRRRRKRSKPSSRPTANRSSCRTQNNSASDSPPACCSAPRRWASSLSSTRTNSSFANSRFARKTRRKNNSRGSIASCRRR